MSGLPPQFDHEQYEELCALATAGALTTEESEALLSHLDGCVECSRVFAQYRSLANQGMPLLADLHRPIPESDRFVEAPALQRLIESAEKIEPEADPERLSFFQAVPPPVWRAALAACLVAGIGFGSYTLGDHHRRDRADPSALLVASTNAKSERRKLEMALEAAQRSEVELQGLVAAREADLEKSGANARKAQEQLDQLMTSSSASSSEMAAQITTLTAQRDAAITRLQDATRLYQNAEDELNTLGSEHKRDLDRIALLESQVGGLTVALNDQNSRTKSDEQYLASDRDIRDLIGARNLYIADIMDVREDGSSRKPFGRVFYTRTKSLVFYAYDLDHQPGVKKTSTFRVWGSSGPEDQRPINLGVLYMDSETNRRWTLRVDNPEQLARLDSVFVTIEPREQSDKPSGKPFLYASLRREPNHP